MKKHTRIIVGLLSILLLGGCSNQNIQEPITIVLDWVPNTNHTGLYVALEKGYFGDLNVEVVQPPEGSTTSLIGSGGAQFGISFQDTLAPAFARENPLPVTAVAALVQHNTSGVISLKESKIERPRDLSGHTYATWDSPIELAILRKVVEGDGGDFESITLIPNTVTDVSSALQTDLDSVWVFYGWDGIGTKVNRLETNFIAFKDYGLELDYYSPVLIANNTYLEEHTEEAKRVLAGIKQGYEYAVENPEEAAQILLKHAPELDETLTIESQKWISQQYKAEVEPWGYINPVRWNAFYNWLNENQLVEQKIEPNTGFSNDYVQP